MHDSGEIKFFRKVNNTTKGQMPSSTYSLIHFGNYDERTVSISRFSSAKQFDSKIALVARIAETRNIEQGEVVAVLQPYAYVDNSVYSVYQVQHLRNDKNLMVCDVSLERLEGLNADQIIGNS